MNVKKWLFGLGQPGRKPARKPQLPRTRLQVEELEPRDVPSTLATFDVDGDGHVDLYVTNYEDWKDNTYPYPDLLFRNRGGDKAYLGTTLIDPYIDYTSMAKTYGLYGEGPISSPKDLAPALKRGIERVKKGEPALIDVVTQPR